MVRLDVTALRPTDLFLTELKSLLWPQSKTASNSAVMMPIRRTPCWDKVGKGGEDSAALFPHTSPDPGRQSREKVGFKKCTRFCFLSCLSFFPLYICFCFALKSLFSTAVINHCRQDPLVNAKIRGKNIMEK